MNRVNDQAVRHAIISFVMRVCGRHRRYPVISNCHHVETKPSVFHRRPGRESVPDRVVRHSLLSAPSRASHKSRLLSRSKPKPFIPSGRLDHNLPGRFVILIGLLEPSIFGYPNVPNCRYLSTARSAPVVGLPLNTWVGNCRQLSYSGSMPCAWRRIDDNCQRQRDKIYENI